jgi:hypothetical protein
VSTLSHSKEIVMDRLSTLGLVAGLVGLAFSASNALAQETGGIALSPEVFKADNAQGQVLDRVLARVQQIQQLRLLNLPGGGAVTSSNLANPASAAPGSDPQSLDAGPSAALALASVLRARTQQPLNPVFQQIFQQQLVDNSRNLMVNAPNSSVSIGNNNNVSQQVSTSTAVSPTGSAVASAGVSTRSGRSRSGKTSGNHTATSTAASTGGTAQAVAINTDISPQAVP